MKNLIYLLLLLISIPLRAQVVSPQVLNAAGSSRALGSSGVSVADNVGEPFVSTLGPASGAMITQGFLQPDAALAQGFSVTVFKNDVSCSDKNDGRIATAITALVSGYQATYVWTPSVACRSANCSAVDSLASGLYSLTVIFTYTTLAHQVKTDTVIVPPQYVQDANGPCKISVFTGVNISGSGQNDHLFIKNIEQYPNNRVTIYNRWGLQLFDKKGYDNTSTYWPSQDEQSKLLPSTYFYIVDIGDGSKPLKGWIELIKN